MCNNAEREKAGNRRLGPINTWRRGLWISTGARLSFVVLTLAMALLTAFVAIPFYADKANRQHQATQTAQARVAQQKRTAAFLHRFDCTYGSALKATLREARRTYFTQAQVARRSRIDASHRHDWSRARTSLLSRRNALATARRYSQLLGDLQPVGPPNLPC